MTFSRQAPKDEPERMARARALGLYGLLTDWSRVEQEPWLEELLSVEEAERKRRSLDRRMRTARIGGFKHMSQYDWNWPKKINRQAVEDTVSGCFIRERSNIVLVGKNGVSKTMIAKNTAHNAASNGYTVVYVSASEMLTDLGEQDSASALSRKLARYCRPDLLCIDEVAYLSYNARAADLLFEVVSTRYNASRSILLTTNKSFEQWNEVFPNAGCVATLVDRLVHRCEVITIDAESFRLKEAKEQATAREKERGASRRKT